MKQRTRIPAAPYICFSSQVSSSITYLILGSTPTLSSQQGLSALAQWPVRGARSRTLIFLILCFAFTGDLGSYSRPWCYCTSPAHPSPT